MLVGMTVVRGTALWGYRELVVALGADPDPLLSGAGLPPEGMGQQDTFMPYRHVINAVEAAAVATRTPDFGRQLAERQGLDILGPLGVALRTAATVGEALDIARVYLSAYSPALAVGMAQIPGTECSFFGFRIVLDRLPPHRQVMELSLGVILAVFRFLWGSDHRPLRVHLPHEPLTVERAYADYFGCAPRFAEPQAGFTLLTQDLNHPVSRDHIAHATVVRYLETLVTHGETDLVVPARELVQRLLPTGTVTLELIARQLALHPRTLQRRLTQQGTTFHRLVDDIRLQITERYLRDTDIAMIHLTRVVGYAEQSVLTRSCKRWFGTGPAEYRRQLREQGRRDSEMAPEVKQLSPAVES